MDLSLEPFDPTRHDQRTVADLVYSSDEDFNALVYGDRPGAVEIITACMGMDSNYYTPSRVRCAVSSDQLVGVIIDFPVAEKDAVDTASGKDFSRAMGMWSFLKRMPLLMRMGRITGGEMDEDGTYIHTLCVDASHRNAGIGSFMLKQRAEEHPRMYVHVNIENLRARRFYEKNGFRVQSEHRAILRRKEMGTVLMRRG